MAERILLVINPTLPCVKNTLAVVQLMDTLEYPETKIQFVINRVTAELERQRITIAVPAIEQRLKRKALGVIPMDERRVLNSVNRGVSVVAKDKSQSPAKDLVTLADALYENLSPKEPAPDEAAKKGAQQKQQPGSRFGKLFGG